MSPDEGAAEAKAKQPALPQTKPGEQFVIFVSMLAAMLILFDPAARNLTGAAVGAVFHPLIGFGGAVPVLTILLASVAMVGITTAVRHYFTDYLAQARAQDVMRAFNKELREARKENNLHKMKKLTDRNQDLMALQAEQSSAALKPMALTMIVVIPIFTWLLVFADPGATAPDVVVAPIEDERAWALQAGDLQRMPGVQAALRAPGQPAALGPEETTFLQQGLRASSSTQQVRYADPALNKTTYYHVRLEPAATGGATLTLVPIQDANAWATTPEQLAAAGFPSAAQALRAPGEHVRLTEAEHQALNGQLAERRTVHLLVQEPQGQRHYLVGLPNPPCESKVRVPWDANWCLDVNVQAAIPLLNLFPRWVALYSLFSIPLGQAIGRWLKARDLEEELAGMKAKPEGAAA